MMRTPGELKLLPAFPVAAYGKVSKVLCALPDTASKVDVNTLTEEQAPLLAALFIGSLSEDEAAVDRLPPGRGLGVDGGIPERA